MRIDGKLSQHGFAGGAVDGGDTVDGVQRFAIRRDHDLGNLRIQTRDTVDALGGDNAGIGVFTRIGIVGETHQGVGSGIAGVAGEIEVVAMHRQSADGAEAVGLDGHGVRVIAGALGKGLHQGQRASAGVARVDAQVAGAAGVVAGAAADDQRLAIGGQQHVGDAISVAAERTVGVIESRVRLAGIGLPLRCIVDGQFDAGADARLAGVVAPTGTAAAVTNAGQGEGARAGGGSAGVVDVANPVDQGLRRRRVDAAAVDDQRGAVARARVGIAVGAGAAAGRLRQVDARAGDDDELVGSIVQPVDAQGQLDDRLADFTGTNGGVPEQGDESAGGVVGRGDSRTGVQLRCRVLRQ